MNVEQSLDTYCAIIRPIIEYCSSLFLHSSLKNIQQIEQIQNRAIRIICHAPKKFSITDARRLLDIPTLVKGMHKHCHSLRSSHTSIKPYFRTNVGKSSFTHLLHESLNLSNTPYSITKAKNLLKFEFD